MEVPFWRAQHADMKPDFAGSAALMILELVLVSDSAPNAACSVPVCVNDNNSINVLALVRAQAIASQMFATAGVAVEWHSAAHASCQELQFPRAIVLDFVTATPGNNPEALASAAPYEGIHATVLVDRLEGIGGTAKRSKFLAHVMTHEITHLLQRISRHAQTGVMKARWDADDLMRMGYTTLPFTPEDIDLIQRGLSRQTADSAPAGKLQHGAECRFALARAR